MKLANVKINKNLILKQIELNTKTKLRLLELGIIPNTIIQVKHISLFKKTFLISFQNSCFTISNVIANNIEVEYE